MFRHTLYYAYDNIEVERILECTLVCLVQLLNTQYCLAFFQT